MPALPSRADTIFGRISKNPGVQSYLYPLALTVISVYVRLQRNEKTSLSGYEISFPEWLHLRLYFRRRYPGLSTGEFSRRHVSYLQQPARDPAGFQSTLGRTPTYYNRLDPNGKNFDKKKYPQEYNVGNN